MCRVLGYSPMLEKIVPLSWRSRSVARVCLAYQAYVNNDYRHQFSHFLEEALELFKLQLQNNDVHADEVLVTGLLLCSVSVSVTPFQIDQQPWGLKLIRNVLIDNCCASVDDSCARARGHYHRTRS